MEIKSNITLLLPLNPFVKNSGGAVAFNNHLAEFSLFDTNLRKVCIIFFNENEFYPEENELECLYPSIHFFFVKNTILSANKNIGYYSRVFFSKLPYDVFYRANFTSFHGVDNIVKNSKFIVCDHIYSYGLLSRYKGYFTVKIIYIAHNIESNILYQRYKLSSSLFRRLFDFFDFIKMENLERRLTKASCKNIYISGNDFDAAKSNNKVLCTELLSINNDAWFGDNEKRKKSVVFIGGSKYFPNLDAIIWISTVLAPLLDGTGIVINIIGSVSDDVKQSYEAKNVYFLGFVSDDVLHRELINCSFFISPITLGSGIKIKMLEALSRGVPIICTRESLHGLEAISSCLVFDRGNPNDCLFQLLDYCSSDSKLSLLSLSIKKEYNDLVGKSSKLSSIFKKLEHSFDEA